MFKKIMISVVICLVVFGAIFAVVNMAEPKTVLERLSELNNNIEPKALPLIKGTVDIGGSSLEDELPDISNYPLSVEGKAPLNIEIFTSTEKGGKGTDGWINDMARGFNKTNGQLGSVSIRPMTSGLMVDYLVSGKHLPDGVTPSFDPWPVMMSAAGADITLESPRLVGNVAGILLKKDMKDKLLQKYGEINANTIVEATIAGDMVMGYTNPLASSAGMNFLITALSGFNKVDPISNEAIKGFENFQLHVPAVAFSTLQMSNAAKNGSLDGFIYEYQLYKNKPDIRRDYEFFPYGLRHDNPIYSVGTLTPEKKQLLDAFIEYCLSKQSQDLATQYGFNGYEDYVSDIPMYSGDVLLSAQSIWKEKKNAGREIIAVFVADVSGSMDGTPLTMLKQSLKNGGNYIKPETKIGIVSFSSEVYIDMPISEFSLNNRAYFNGAVDAMKARTGTATYNGVFVALSMLQEELAKNPNAKGMLFLLSDGEQNEGYSLQTLEPIAKELKIPIHTIGYTSDTDLQKTLQEVSNINEAAAITATPENVLYILKNFFNAEM